MARNIYPDKNLRNRPTPHFPRTLYLLNSGYGVAMISLQVQMSLMSFNKLTEIVVTRHCYRQQGE